MNGREEFSFFFLTDISFKLETAINEIIIYFGGGPLKGD